MYVRVIKDNSIFERIEGIPFCAKEVHVGGDSMRQLIPRRKKAEGDIMMPRIDNFFDKFFDRIPTTLGFRRSMEDVWAPLVDVYESNDKITVRAEIPGLEPKDIHVSLTGNVLTIEGEKQQEKEEGNENYHRVERYYGSFKRDIELPAEVVGENIEAFHKNGVLTIELPKSEKTRKKQVNIKVN